jgi:hypothetical protein
VIEQAERENRDPEKDERQPEVARSVGVPDVQLATLFELLEELKDRESETDQ